MSVDLGRLVLDGGPGDGEAEFLANGLLRHRGPLGAGALMLRVLLEQVQGRYLPASAHRIVRIKKIRGSFRKEAFRTVY
jgi:hypothetical protein